MKGIAINIKMVVARVVSTLAAKNYRDFFWKKKQQFTPRTSENCIGKSVLTQIFSAINSNEQLLTESL